jgi:hypothetical protein
MPGVHQAIETAAPPRWNQLEADLQDRCLLLEDVERQRTEVAALDPRDRGLRNPGAPSHIFLSQAPVDPDGSEQRAKLGVVHMRDGGLPTSPSSKRHERTHKGTWGPTSGVILRRSSSIDPHVGRSRSPADSLTLTRSAPFVYPSHTGTFVRVVSADTLCQTAAGCAARGLRTVRRDW